MVFAVAFLIPVMPFIVGGFRIILGKLKYRKDAGLIFLNSQSGNFSFPYVCDLRVNKFEISINKKKYTFPIKRELFHENGTFFGMPYVMYPVEDCKNSIGLYYHESDENGEPLYYLNDNKQPIMPKLTKIKNAVSFPPSLIEALVGEEALTEALSKLFKDNQMFFYLIIGNIIVAGISVYFMYELTSTAIPNIESLLQQIIGLVSK